MEVTSEAVLLEYADLAKQVTYVCHQKSLSNMKLEQMLT